MSSPVKKGAQLDKYQHVCMCVCATVFPLLRRSVCSHARFFITPVVPSCTRTVRGVHVCVTGLVAALMSLSTAVDSLCWLFGSLCSLASAS